MNNNETVNDIFIDDFDSDTETSIYLVYIQNPYCLKTEDEQISKLAKLFNMPIESIQKILTAQKNE